MNKSFSDGTNESSQHFSAGLEFFKALRPIRARDDRSPPHLWSRIGETFLWSLPGRDPSSLQTQHWSAVVLWKHHAME